MHGGAVPAAVDQGRRHVVLGGQGVAAGDDHVGASRLQDPAEVGGLGLQVDAQADGVEELAAGVVHGEAVEQADAVDGLAVLLDSVGEGGDAGNALIRELDALHCIAVGDVAVAQGVFLGGVAEDVVDAGFIVDARGDIGAVPDAVGFGLGDVILENRQGAGAGGIDGRFGNSGRKGGGDDGQAQGQHKAQSKESLEMFHDRYLHKFEF